VKYPLILRVINPYKPYDAVPLAVAKVRFSRMQRLGPGSAGSGLFLPPRYGQRPKHATQLEHFSAPHVSRDHQLSQRSPLKRDMDAKRGSRRLGWRLRSGVVQDRSVFSTVLGRSASLRLLYVHGVS